MMLEEVLDPRESLAALAAAMFGDPGPEPEDGADSASNSGTAGEAMPSAA